MFTLIESLEDLDFLNKELLNKPYLGVDTEFRRTTKDNMRLALLQVNDEEEIYLIDAILIKDPKEHASFLYSESVTKILHSCKEDLEAVYSWTKKEMINIFDTQIANSFLDGDFTISYQGLVEQELGIILNKNETRSNWLRRPLTDKQLKYAADDVNFLISIYEKQLKKLKKLKKEKVVNLEFTKEIRLGNQELHISRLRKLKKASNVEKDIFLWREKYAKEKNIPPSYVFGNKDLKKISNKIKNKEKEPYEIKKLFKDNSAAKDFLKYIKL